MLVSCWLHEIDTKVLTTMVGRNAYSAKLSRPLSRISEGTALRVLKRTSVPGCALKIGAVVCVSCLWCLMSLPTRPLLLPLRLKPAALGCLVMPLAFLGTPDVSAGISGTSSSE